MYGGDGARESRPNFVSAQWKVASEFVKDYKGTVSPALFKQCSGHAHQIMDPGYDVSLAQEVVVGLASLMQTP